MIFNYARQPQQTYRPLINLDQRLSTSSSSYQRRPKPPLNATEGKFYDTSKAVGLDLKAQYPISQMHVDFASPVHKVAIEINGPHHDLPRYQEIDRRRAHVLNQHGWTVYTFTADHAYNCTHDLAHTVQDILKKREEATKTFIDPFA